MIDSYYWPATYLSMRMLYIDCEWVIFCKKLFNVEILSDVTLVNTTFFWGGGAVKMTANQRWQMKWLTCRPPHASTNGDRTSRRNGQVVNVAVNHCLDCERRLRCCSEKWRCWRPSCVAIVWAHYNWIPWYLRAVFTLFPVSTTKLPTDSPGCHITQDFDCTTFLLLVLTVIRQFTFFFLSGWSASFFFFSGRWNIVTLLEHCISTTHIFNILF